MKKNIFLIFCFSLFTFSGFANSPNEVKITADKSTSKVTYFMSHPLHDFSGVNKNVNAVATFDKNSKEIVSAVVVLAVTDFNSGNDSRDAHAKEDLNAAKYPFVTFSSTSVKRNGKGLKVEGTLNFHGVKRKIAFLASETRDGSKMAFDGGFNVDMTNYKVKQPSLMGIKTDKMIKLSFHLEFKIS